MKLKDFDYNLPKELIAQKASKPRDHSRLLVFKRDKNIIEHKKFFNIIDYLNSGDVLVLNNSKVFPARLLGNKKDSGGKVEIFLHRKIKGQLWQCILGGRNVKLGLEVEFSQGLKAKVLKNNNDGTWDVIFNKSGNQFMSVINSIGLMPLPPYIKRDKKVKSDKDNYQTVYAQSKKTGSVAAPTAGLHFTPQLLKKIKQKGIEIEFVTLHVGLGTFAPVKTDDITKHKMHTEFAQISKKTLQNILKAKKEKRRVVAVGTTSVRVLEGIVKEELKKQKNNLKALLLLIKRQRLSLDC